MGYSSLSLRRTQTTGEKRSLQVKEKEIQYVPLLSIHKKYVSSFLMVGTERTKREEIYIIFQDEYTPESNSVEIIDFFF